MTYYNPNLTAWILVSDHVHMDEIIPLVNVDQLMGLTADEAVSVEAVCYQAIADKNATEAAKEEARDLIEALSEEFVF